MLLIHKIKAFTYDVYLITKIFFLLKFVNKTRIRHNNKIIHVNNKYSLYISSLKDEILCFNTLFSQLRESSVDIKHDESINIIYVVLGLKHLQWTRWQNYFQLKRFIIYYIITAEWCFNWVIKILLLKHDFSTRFSQLAKI